MEWLKLIVSTEIQLEADTHRSNQTLKWTESTHSKEYYVTEQEGAPAKEQNAAKMSKTVVKEIA